MTWYQASVYAERELGGFFLDSTPDREAIARYGLTVRDVLDVVETSIGGIDVDTTFEGRERYAINVRYPRELRDNLEALQNVLVPIPRLVPRPAPGGAGARQAPSPTASAPAMSGTATAGDSMGGSPLTTLLAALPSGAASMAGDSMGAGQTRAADPGAAAFVPLGQLAHIETVLGPL